MKNLLFAIAICFMMPFNLHSQKVALEAGLNFNNVNSEQDVDLDNSNGFHAGILIEVPIIDPLRVGTGLYYTRRGYKSNEIDREGSVYIDYIDIPIDMMLHFKIADLAGGFVSFGPYFSYGFSSEVINLDGLFENGYSSEDIDLQRLDAGVNFGVGVEFGNLRLSSTYSLSATDNGAEANNQLKNRVLSISFGIFLN